MTEQLPQIQIEKNGNGDSSLYSAQIITPNTATLGISSEYYMTSIRKDSLYVTTSLQSSLSSLTQESLENSNSAIHSSQKQSASIFNATGKSLAEIFNENSIVSKKSSVRSFEMSDSLGDLASLKIEIPSNINFPVDASLSLRFRSTVIYHAELPDEIDIAPGDEIMVIKEFTDGWAFGYNENSRIYGVFPQQCVIASTKIPYIRDNSISKTPLGILNKDDTQVIMEKSGKGKLN